MEGALALPLNDVTMSEHIAFDPDILQYPVAGCILQIPTKVFWDNNLMDALSVTDFVLSMAVTSTSDTDINFCCISDPSRGKVDLGIALLEVNLPDGLIIRVGKDSKSALDAFHNAIDSSRLDNTPTVDVIIVVYPELPEFS